MMKILFLTNYYSHHQQELACHLDRQTGGNFLLGELSAMEEDRRSLGWDRVERPDYVRRITRQEAARLIGEYDVILLGEGAGTLARAALRAGKVVFRWSERPLKKGNEPLKYLPRYLRWRRWWPNHPRLWLLAAGGGTAEDYSRFGLFRDRAVKWGYFPPVRQYDEGLWERKDPGFILWAGRFLELKRPQLALEIAAELRDEGIPFHMELIGTGPLEGELRAMEERLELTDRVSISGPVTPEEVRDRMERAGIFLFTSDRREGWGAVLGEAMNGGCAVVNDEAPGAVSFLLRDGENGLVCPSGDRQAFFQRVRELLLHPEEQLVLGRAAYRTIAEQWNGAQAAKALTELAGALGRGNTPVLPPDGPCSRAGGAP